MHVDQQRCIAHELEIRSIEVCYVQKIHIQDSSCFFLLTSPSSPVSFYLHPSRDPEAADLFSLSLVQLSVMGLRMCELAGAQSTSGYAQ